MGQKNNREGISVLELTKLFPNDEVARKGALRR